MAKSATIIGFQPVGAYEARQLARAEQRRARAAKSTLATLKGLHATINQLDHGIRHHERELAVTRGKIADRDAREHRSELSGRVYGLLIAILLLLEVPLNMAALDFLRRPQLESLGMALFVGGVTALAAKFTGRVLRQATWDGQGIRAWAMALIFNVAIVLAIWRVAELRGRLAGNPSAGVTVMALQFAGYVAVVGFTFAHLDPNPTREQLTRLLAIQEQRLDRLWRERGQLANRYNKALADAELTLAEIEHDAVERVMEYRDHNMRRRSAPTPEYFRRAVTQASFHPINLGTPLDDHPRTIGEVMGHTNQENENE
jgi:hypothetical protein